MTVTSKREYLSKVRERYRRAGRGYKARILDEFCVVCGYERKWAIRLLNRRLCGPSKRPGPEATYGPDLFKVLKEIWLASGQMCGKRLKEALPLWMPHYRGGLSPEARALLLAASAATLDRLLAPARARYGRRGLGGTKPGALLKTQIPIRTDNWDVSGPGYMEADTVAHCGTSLAGDFIWSVVLTDIYSGWTCQRAVWNKGSGGVIEAISDMEKKLPFALLGFDCDNGSEFLNYHLLAYFAQRPRPVGFTRSRPYHKNDNAHVEQKNWTHARQLLGYERLAHPELVEPINALYGQEWELLQNFFSPSMKLKKKQRIGARQVRHHDKAQTPLARLLESPAVDAARRNELETLYAKLDPFKLSQKVERKLSKIWQDVRRRSLAATPVALRAPCVAASENLPSAPVS
jgi:hypothetical protein